MNKNQNGFGALGILVVLTVISILGIVTWQFLSRNNSSPSVSKSDIIQTKVADKTEKPAEKVESEKISSKWVLRESSEASIRIPDGFNFLALDDELINFDLPDVPQGTLRYEPGVPAKDVGETHKHFELGLVVQYNSLGLNALGSYSREFKTYSDLSVRVDLYEHQTVADSPSTFADKTKYLKYTVTKDDKFFCVNYLYLGEGIVPIIDEMVKSIEIK